MAQDSLSTIQVTPNGNINTITGISTTDSPASNIDVSSIAADETTYPSEWVYPSYTSGKYLTGAQTRLYIGNLFIDEVTDLEVSLSNNKVPLYGYSSKRADAFAEARELAQGQLTINFVSEGYLYTVLQEYNKFNKQGNGFSEQSNTLASLLLSQQKLKARINATKDSSTLSALNNQLIQTNTKINNIVSSSSSRILKEAKQIVQNPEVLTTGVNACDLDIPFDIIVKSIGGGRVTTRQYKNCVLISNQTLFDTSDNTMKDSYGFIARYTI